MDEPKLILLLQHLQLLTKQSDCVFLFSFYRVCWVYKVNVYLSIVDALFVKLCKDGGVFDVNALVCVSDRFSRAFSSLAVSERCSRILWKYHIYMYDNFFTPAVSLWTVESVKFCVVLSQEHSWLKRRKNGGFYTFHPVRREISWEDVGGRGSLTSYGVSHYCRYR